jgi:alkylated DNA nucleotide flippase Atl1
MPRNSDPVVRLQDIEAELRDSPNEWRWYAAHVIADIPYGCLASYGTIADEANRRYGLAITALNIGWLRRHLNDRTQWNSDLPLHRIATAGDINCANDSRPQTIAQCRKLRTEEGTWNNPDAPWWDPRPRST